MRELFEVLIRENERMLWAFLRSVLNEKDAEDVFQQTCLTAWTALKRYDKTRPFGPWLRGIASRLLLEHWRRKGGALPLDARALEALDARIERLGDLPGAGWDEKLQALRDCLKGVEDDDQKLLDFYYRDNLSCGDIAARFGTHAETIKKRLQRIRSSLLSCLEGKRE